MPRFQWEQLQEPSFALHRTMLPYRTDFFYKELSPSTPGRQELVGPWSKRAPELCKHRDDTSPQIRQFSRLEKPIGLNSRNSRV